jgi:geranylgeranyl diphosphate synthase type I
MGEPKITKKPVGNDLREGKKSLPILMAIKLAKGKDKKIILNAFGNPKSTKNDLKNAVDVIRSLGIEDNVRTQALEYAERAKKSLSKYSGSAKTELIDLLDFVVKRSL